MVLYHNMFDMKIITFPILTHVSFSYHEFIDRILTATHFSHPTKIFVCRVLVLKGLTQMSIDV